MFLLPQYDYRAYGWLWRSEIELNLFHPVPLQQRSPDIYVSLGATGSEPNRKIISTIQRSSIADDGFRFRDGEHAVIDSVGISRINIYPGLWWKGIPASFYGTSTGALMVWKGGIPFHASAVEVNGKALLICGPGGAGKSTATAALLTRGARLISDDLSVLRPLGGGSPPVIYGGRRTIRLFPKTAARVRECCLTESIRTRGPKELLVVESIPTEKPIPFGGFVFLGMSREALRTLGEAELLNLVLYRPGIFGRIRGSRLRQMTAKTLLATSPAAFCPDLELSGDFSLEQIANSVLNSWQKFSSPLQ